MLFLKKRFAQAIYRLHAKYSLKGLTNINKGVNIFCTLPEWIRYIPMTQRFSTIKTCNIFIYYKGENLAWLTQKTEEKK